MSGAAPSALSNASKIVALDTAAVPRIVELRLERGERLARLPVGIGDDRDGLFELHDALDARHLLRGRGIDRDQLAAEDRRNLDRGVQHARRS